METRGERNGIDKRCRLQDYVDKVADPIITTIEDSSMKAAIDMAAERVSRAKAIATTQATTSNCFSPSLSSCWVGIRHVCLYLNHRKSWIYSDDKLGFNSPQKLRIF